MPQYFRPFKHNKPNLMNNTRKNNQSKFIESAGFGLGLRQKHVKQIIKNTPKEINWFEIISENYLNSESEKRLEIEKIRQDYPFVMHGVSMSIGSTDEIDINYLQQLKELANWLSPEIISDHICWTGINNFNSHDLLPVPYTEESLKNMINKIQQVQDFLGRKIALENPSTYLEFDGSTIPEWEYIKYVAEEADCDLLLDINNVYVNCFNHKYNSKQYINHLPEERIVQIHLAGHKNCGTHIIDTHSDHINDDVLDLYQYTINKIGARNSMIEWDADIPEFEILIDELNKVRKISNLATNTNDNQISTPKSTTLSDKGTTNKEDSLNLLYTKFQSSLLKPRENEYPTEEWIKEKQEISEQEQLNIYSFAYRQRLFDLIKDEFKASQIYFGEDNFSMLVRSYIEYNPSQFRNIDDYITAFPNFTQKYIDEIGYELVILECEIFKLQESIIGTSTTQEFNNQVNDLYKACHEGTLDEVKLENIQNHPIKILLEKESDGVYRSII